MMKSLVLYAIARLREPTTYLGLSWVVSAVCLKFGLQLSAEDQASWAKDIAAAGMAIGGLAGMAIKDFGNSWK